MKEYRMLETRKGEAEALMNWMAREGWEVVGVTYWSAWKLCLLITFPGASAGERRGDRDEETASGPGDAALRHGGIHRLVHGGGDEGGARGTEPDIRLPLRDGLAPGAVLFAAMAAAGLVLAVREARRDS